MENFKVIEDNYCECYGQENDIKHIKFIGNLFGMPVIICEECIKKMYEEITI